MTTNTALQRDGGPAPRVYSYVRFSTPEQALGDSRRRQVEAAQEWAAARGLTLDDELRDEGVSGYRGANLAPTAALGSFRRAVEAGLVPEGSILIVESLDRLSRDHLLYAQNLFGDLLLKGITVVTLADGREYSLASVNANPTDLIASILVFMRANEESAMKARRLRAAWDSKRTRAAREGHRMTRTAPAWLRAEGEGWAVIEDRAEVVREMFQLTLAGHGQHAIARALTERGVPTWDRGKVWHRTYVRKVLDNPAVVGALVPHVLERAEGGKRRRRPLNPIENYYPAVIDSETWARTRAILGTRDRPRGARGRHSGAPVRSLLARLAVCPLCGSTMTRVYKGAKGGRPRLVCVLARGGGDCQYHSIDLADVEGVVFDQAHRLVDDAPPSSANEEAAAERVRNLEHELDAVEAELDEFASRRRALTTAERATRASLFSQLEQLRAELSEARRQLAESGSAIVRDRLRRLETVLAQGPQEDLTEANRALAEAVEAVVVDYPKGVLRFRWRHGGESELTYRFDWGG